MNDVVFTTDYLKVVDFALTGDTLRIKCSNGQTYSLPYNSCPVAGQEIKIQFDSHSREIDWSI